MFIAWLHVTNDSVCLGVAMGYSLQVCLRYLALSSFVLEAAKQQVTFT